MRKLLISAALVTAGVLTACGAAKEAAVNALGTMTFKGTVTRAGSGAPIEGATVRAIQLLDEDAIKSLVRYEKIPDGTGGKKDQLRIDLTKVHAFAADKEVKTDAAGQFTFEAPTNIYLVYTFGPGQEPGGATAYSVHFWGINPETGELDLKHLIGANGLTEQTNDAIELAGGPGAPMASSVPAAPAGPAEPDTAPASGEAAEPTTGSTPANPEDVVPPAPNATFWKSINLVHKDGTLGTESGTYASDAEVAPAEGERYMMLKAELSAAQTDPVYLVIQTGFDSTTINDCGAVRSTAQTHVYPVTANGTSVEYKLVSPGSYYKLFFAKTAAQVEGQAVEASDATEALRIGKRICDDTVPERPFLATLTWNRESDVDLHVLKYDATKVAAGELNDALVDQANWTRREGTTLSLDVDNTYAYGPENNGEAASVTDADKYCYVVQLHLYSKSGDEAVQANVHVIHVVKDAGVTKVNQYDWTGALTEYGKWTPVGIYGPAGCEKLNDAPAAG